MGLMEAGARPSLDDRSLVEGFVARRTDAFVGLCEAYAVEMCSIAHHVLRDRAWAEDCVHDALLRLWRSPGAYLPERGSLRAFLLVCVRNEALDQLRGANLRAASELKSHGLELPATEIRLLDPVDAAQVRDAIAALPEEQRDALLRAYYKNRSLVQIAEETQSSPGTVKNRVTAALVKFTGEFARALKP